MSDSDSCEIVPGQSTAIDDVRTRKVDTTITQFFAARDSSCPTQQESERVRAEKESREQTFGLITHGSIGQTRISTPSFPKSRSAGQDKIFVFSSLAETPDVDIKKTEASLTELKAVDSGQLAK